MTMTENAKNIQKDTAACIESKGLVEKFLGDCAWEPDKEVQLSAYDRMRQQYDKLVGEGKAQKEVLDFIFKFAWHNGHDEFAYEVIRSQFRAGYCYFFAEMLHTAFGRGTICWCAPYGHICWMDEDGIPYDIEGVCNSGCKYYIPVSYIQEGLVDYLHVPGKEFCASKRYILDAIHRYEADMGLR